MIVLFWSRATRDLLKSFGWGIAATPSVRCSDEVATFPRRPPHSIFRFRASGDTPQRPRGEAAFDGAEPSQRITHTAIFCKGDVEADVLCPRACARLARLRRFDLPFRNSRRASH